MEAIKMIKTRRSIRNFTEDKVSEEVINKIIDASRFSPSWVNFQVARYHVIQDDAIIKEIAQKGVNEFVYNINTLSTAQNLLVLTYVAGKSGRMEPKEDSDYLTSKQESWEIFDTGIAAQTFCLAAHANKVGTCIMGVIDDKSIAEIIGLPADQSVGALIAFGYPDEDEEVDVPDRLEVDQLVTFH